METLTFFQSSPSSSERPLPHFTLQIARENRRRSAIFENRLVVNPGAKAFW